MKMSNNKVVFVHVPAENGWQCSCGFSHPRNEGGAFDTTSSLCGGGLILQLFESVDADGNPKITQEDDLTY